MHGLVEPIESTTIATRIDQRGFGVRLIDNNPLQAGEIEKLNCKRVFGRQEKALFGSIKSPRKECSCR